MHNLKHLAIAILLISCGQKPEPEEFASTTLRDPGPYEEAGENGIEFTYDNGSSGQFYLPEIIGAGGALFDFDNDGDLDVYLPQGFTLGTSAEAEHKLFRNDLQVTPQGEAFIKFIDVTNESGLNAKGYGMGAAAGDYDNDGFVDLYITQFGNNRLFRNQGNGTFRDVTLEAGADDDRWSVSASFFDYNADGFLDLFIGNYTNFTLASHTPCFGPGPVYCHPLNYGAVPDKLLKNLGNGAFQDVSEESGITRSFGRALGVITADFNGDQRTDIYVACDGTVNQFWVNLGNDRFEDRALQAGCGLNASGMPEAGMGVDAADFDGDGDEDLFITHLMGESNTIYINDGLGNFEDQTPLRGLAAPSHSFTGFGAAWTDFNNDGNLDLITVNGAVSPIDTLAGDPFPYHQTNQLFQALGNGHYREVDGGKPFDRSEVSRGAVLGDLDNDGDEDVLIINNNAPVRLLFNRSSLDNKWLGLRLLERNRDALGAKAGLLNSEGNITWRRVHTDGSYASSSDPRIVIPLTNQEPPFKIRVVWADGKSEQFSLTESGVYAELTRGEGESP